MPSHVRLPRPNYARQVSLPVPSSTLSSPLHHNASHIATKDATTNPNRSDTTLHHTLSEAPSHHSTTVVTAPATEAATTPANQQYALPASLQKRLQHTPRLQLHVSAFTSLRRTRHTPDVCIVQTARLPTDASTTTTTTTTKPSSSFDDYLKCSTGLEWRTVTVLKSLPAVTSIPCTPDALLETAVRLSFSTTSPARHLGDATTPLVYLLRGGAYPVHAASGAMPIVGIAQARAAALPRRLANPPAFQTGVSFHVRVAASMRREARHATTIALTRVGGGGGLSTPLPMGCTRMVRRRDRATSICVQRDALWFGLDGLGKRSAAAALRIEWLGAPSRKGTRFVHGAFEVALEEVAHVVPGELRGVLWADGAARGVVNRSVLIEDVALRDGCWCVELSLTR